MFDILIATDGSCKPQLQSKPGGWAAVLKYGDYIRSIKGGAFHTTSQQMELKAVIEAIRLLKEPCNITLETDSQYVVGVGSGKYCIRENTSLWFELFDLIRKGRHTVNYVKVKGHSGHPLNEECDYLAREAVETLMHDNRLSKKDIDDYYRTLKIR